MEAVLVIDDYPQTLAVVRALSHAGLRVYIARGPHRSIAESSRYANGGSNLVCEDPNGMALRLNHFLEQHPDISCLLPLSEGTIARVHTMADCLPDIPIAAVGELTLQTCTDKSLTNKAARDAGLTVPAGGVVHNYEELTSLISAIGFPVVLKSPSNHALLEGNKALVVRSQADLNRKLPDWPNNHSDLMVQEFIGGDLVGCDFVASQGHIVAYYQGQVLRTDRLDGTGYGVEFSSALPVQDLFNALERMVRQLKYTGPGLFQAIRCERSGKLFFIEINPRFAAGLTESLKAGVNLPVAAVAAALGEPRPCIASHEQVRFQFPHVTHWLERDLRGWMGQRRYLTPRQSVAWLWQMVRAFIRCHTHANWDWRDPVPTFRIYSRVIRDFTRSSP